MKNTLSVPRVLIDAMDKLQQYQKNTRDPENKREIAKLLRELGVLQSSPELPMRVTDRKRK